MHASSLRYRYPGPSRARPRQYACLTVKSFIKIRSLPEKQGHIQQGQLKNDILVVSIVQGSSHVFETSIACYRNHNLPWPKSLRDLQRSHNIESGRGTSQNPLFSCQSPAHDPRLIFLNSHRIIVQSFIQHLRQEAYPTPSTECWPPYPLVIAGEEAGSNNVTWH